MWEPVSKCRLFKLCSERFRNEIVRCLEQQFFPANYSIEQGNVCGVYFVRKGQIKVKPANKSSFVRKFPGNCFGEECALLGSMEMEVISVTDCELWYLPANKLKGLLANSSFAEDRNLVYSQQSRERRFSGGFLPGSAVTADDTRRRHVLMSIHDLQSLRFVKIKNSSTDFFCESGQFYVIWNLAMQILIFYNMLMISFGIGFPFLAPEALKLNYWTYIDLLSDMWFICDFALRAKVFSSNESIEENSETSIFTKYSKKPSFKYHVLSLFPLELFYLVISGSSVFTFPSLYFLLRLNKVFRVNDLWLYYQKHFENWSISSYFLNNTSSSHRYSAENDSVASSSNEIQRKTLIWKYFCKCLECFLLILFIAHFIACCFGFLIQCEVLLSKNGTNFHRFHGFSEQYGLSSSLSEYLLVIYWVITFLSAVGYGDITPVSNKEKVFNIVFYGIGTAILGIIIGSFQNLATESDYSKNLFAEKQKLVQKFVQNSFSSASTAGKYGKQIYPESIKSEETLFEESSENSNTLAFSSSTSQQKQFQRWLDCYYQNSWDLFHGETASALPKIFCNQLLEIFFASKLEKEFSKIFFFKNHSKEFHRCLLSKLQIHLYSSEEIIFHEGEAANQLYFMVTGEVLFFNKVNNQQKKVVNNNSSIGALSAEEIKNNFNKKPNNNNGFFRGGRRNSRATFTQQDNIHYSRLSSGYFSEGDFFLRSLYFCSSQCSSASSVVLSLSYQSFKEVLQELNLQPSFRHQLQNNLSQLRKKTTESMVVGFNDHITNNKMKKMLSTSLGKQIVEQKDSKTLQSVNDAVILTIDLIGMILFPLLIAFPMIYPLGYVMISTDLLRLFLDFLSVVSCLFAEVFRDGAVGSLSSYYSLSTGWEVIISLLLFSSVILFLCLPPTEITTAYLIVRGIGCLSLSSWNRLFSVSMKEFSASSSSHSISFKYCGLFVLVLEICLFLHILCCGFIFIGFSSTHSNSSWIQGNQENFSYNASKDFDKIYFLALYWIVYTLATVGYGSVSLVSDGERVYAMLMMIVGTIFTAYLSSLLSNVIQSFAYQNPFLPIAPMEIFRRVNKEKKLQSQEFFHSVENYFLYLENTLQQSSLSDEIIFDEYLPSQLQFAYNVQFLSVQQSFFKRKFLKDDRFPEVSLCLLPVLVTLANDSFFK
jgi:CRP-like cAMP-binding protein